ncbi:MAG: RNA polymerase sigma factor RpoD/SigA [Sphingomonadales bacterium]|nr:RNA polymerase sigma factor RpoD/SigA [Sphingomonadales bacterium]
MRQLKIIRQITSRDQISLDKYLMEIGRIEILDADREAELARRAKAGDSEALEQLVSANLRFAVSVAKQYQHQGLALSDLINEGNLGLIKAAGRFDETRGFKFISYAVWWIRQSILQALADQGRVVRLPLNRVGLMSRISKLGSRMEQELQRDVSDQEIAAMLEISSAEVGETFTLSLRHLSMDAPVTDDEDVKLMDRLEDKDRNLQPGQGLEQESLVADIESSLRELPSREAEIIRCFFGISGRSVLGLDELSARFELSRERVRQIKERSLRRLRSMHKTQRLRGYMG